MPERARRAGSRSLVVLAPPRWIDQYRVGLADFSEALGRSRIAGATIRVPLQSLTPIGAADLVLGGRPRDTEDRVVVLVERCSGHRVMGAPGRYAADNRIDSRRATRRAPPASSEHTVVSAAAACGRARPTDAVRPHAVRSRRSHSRRGSPAAADRA